MTADNRVRVLLRDVVFARAGDKGDTNNIIVCPYEVADYEWVIRHVTADAIAPYFRPIVTGTIERYELPGICGVNFVMRGALHGGVSRSLNLDSHGKSRGSLLLSITLDVDTPPHTVTNTLRSAGA